MEMSWLLGAVWRNTCLNILEGEALGLLFVIQSANVMGMQHVLFKLDCKTVEDVHELW